MSGQRTEGRGEGGRDSRPEHEGDAGQAGRGNENRALPLTDGLEDAAEMEARLRAGSAAHAHAQSNRTVEGNSSIAGDMSGPESPPVSDGAIASDSPAQPYTSAVARTPTPPRRRRSRIGTAMRMVAALVVLAVLAMGAGAAWVLNDVPWQDILNRRGEPVVMLHDSHGEPVSTNGPSRSSAQSIDEFPQHLIDAVLAIEDRRFYAHPGIDFTGMGRAFVRNLGAGTVVQGGSTITQQLAKVLYLERDRTYRRKLQEVAVAMWLDARLSKDEILLSYLNNIYLGAGATGVHAAARIYFDKEPDALSVAEAAIIAGLIRAPSALNPIDNPDGARQRAAVVLRAMEESGRLEAEQADVARAEVTAYEAQPRRQGSESWFADWAMGEARRIAAPFEGAVNVRTTLMPEIQEIADRVVREMLESEGEEVGASQAALVALRPDGAVLAMTGGRDYGENAFNRAVSAQRQPGSTFKLFVYYAALKAGLSPNQMIVDGPVDINGWQPQNFGGRYHGDVSMAEAFARSLNAATVRLAEYVGIDKVAEAARELGIDAPLSETPSLALGASEVNLLDLTGAYASVLAGAAPIEPWGIEAFSVGADGRSFRAGPRQGPQTDLGAHHHDMVGLLRLVVERGTGRNALLPEFSAGKTGTSQNFRDAWFVGFTEDLVVGVWVGNDDGTPMREVTGGGLPTKIWSRFVAEARGLPVEPGEDGDIVASVIGAEDEGEAQLAGLAVPLNLPQGVEGQGSEAAPMCDLNACSRRYRSFRASDCTYQPYRGERRICDIGMPGMSAASSRQASEPGVDRTISTSSTGGERDYVAEIRELEARRASERSMRRGGSAQMCNVNACERAYRSFRASDCTYQPYGGARRLCTR